MEACAPFPSGDLEYGSMSGGEGDCSPESQCFEVSPDPEGLCLTICTDHGDC